MTEVHQHVYVHASNLHSAVSEDELGMHLVDAGTDCPVRVELSKRNDGKSNCHGWVTFYSAEAALKALEIQIPLLYGREVKLRIDHLSEVDGNNAAAWSLSNHFCQLDLHRINTLKMRLFRLAAEAIS